MKNIGLFIIILVFNLAVLFSLASIGNKIYHEIIMSKYLSSLTKIGVLIILTICAFLIVLFLLDIVFRLRFFM